MLVCSKMYAYVLCRSSDGFYYTTIAFTISGGAPALLINTANAGGTSPLYTTVTPLPHSSLDGGTTSATFDLQLLLDHSLIEVQ